MIRRAVLEKRKALSEDEIYSKSQVVCARFLSEFQTLKVSLQAVGLYRAFQGELDLKFLETYFESQVQSHDSSTVVCYPRVANAQTKVLQFIKTPKHWEKGPYGIAQPLAEAAVCNIKPEELSIIFVPGVCFDQTGHRIGYGHGYYDRYLVKAPQALKVALIYDFQWAEPWGLGELPKHAHDIPMDWILSETQEFRGPRLNR